MVDEIIQHPSLRPIYFWPYSSLMKYENLLLKGHALHEMLVTGEKDFSEEIKQQLDKVFDEYGEAPYPKVLRRGISTCLL